MAESRLAVQQWELTLAESRGRHAADAWQSERLTSFSAWLTSAWEAQGTAPATARDRRLLSHGQTQTLWRKLIDESDEGRWLLSSDGMARLAREARRGLHAHGLDPDTVDGADWRGDAGHFLRWNRRFGEHLDENGWIDPDTLLYRLNRLALSKKPAPIVWLDPGPTLPERRKLENRWRAYGATCTTVFSAGQRADCRALLAPDPSAELELAVAWAEARLADEPAQRLAVVIPDLASRLTEIETLLAERLGRTDFCSSLERSILDRGIFGAAMTAFEVLQAGNDFTAIARLLRSPFFALAGHEETAQREALERWLRRDPRTGSNFVEAYLRFGLRQEFARRAPEIGKRLDAALEQLPRRATPTGWAQALQSSLRTLGWLGYEQALPDALAAAWDDIWSSFSELTAIVGSVELDTALAELQRVCAAQSTHKPLSLHGVHVVNGIQDVGPGYSGVWITGFNDLSWPDSEPSNPLVPWSIRRSCGMPGTAPDSELEAALASLERFSQRVPEAIFSCPEKVLDEPQLPNPHIGGWQRARALGTGAASIARARIGRRAWEQLADTAPPLPGATLPGGPRTLNLQARNPMLAFCTARLGTQALRSAGRGIDGRQRGILMHRVLEFLYQSIDPERAPENALAAAIRRAVEELPPGDSAWCAQVDAEKARLAEQLRRLAAIEGQREPFRTRATEMCIDTEIDGRRLRCRIDRLDELVTGQVLIIDYKTGRSSKGSWFGERLTDCQLPLYAQGFRESVAGIAVLSLGEAGVEYRAAGAGIRDLPGRHQLFDDTAWGEQLDRWREQLAQLVGEFVAGDVRLSTDLSDREALAFASLTRVREQLG